MGRRHLIWIIPVNIVIIAIASLHVSDVLYNRKLRAIKPGDNMARVTQLLGDSSGTTWKNGVIRSLTYYERSSIRLISYMIMWSQDYEPKNYILDGYYTYRFDASGKVIEVFIRNPQVYQKSIE